MTQPSPRRFAWLTLRGLALAGWLLAGAPCAAQSSAAPDTAPPSSSAPILPPPPKTALGHSAPGKPPPPKAPPAKMPPGQTPVVQAPQGTHAQKPAAKPHPAGTAPAQGAAKGPPPKPGATKSGAPAAAPPAPTPSPPPAAEATPTTPAEPAKGTATGLPLPRWASLRADEVNLRSGPGTRYPIEWVYRRRDLPVKIEREFEVWRLIEDQDGVKGWVHQATLTGRRGFVVRAPEQVMRRAPADDAAPVARLKPGVVGRIRSCDAGAAWCEVQVGDYRGWLPRSVMWGIEPAEAVN